MPRRKKTPDASLEPEGPRVPRKADDELPVIAVKKLLAKARVLTSEVEEAAAIQAIDEEADSWQQISAVPAQYDPESLLRYIQLTPHLRPCIDAMAQNTVGFGYRAVEIEGCSWLRDLSTEDAREAVRVAFDFETYVDDEEDALRAAADREKIATQIDALREANSADRTLCQLEKQLDDMEEEAQQRTSPSPASDEQVTATIERLRVQQQRERLKFDAFFRRCCSESSFTKLRVDVMFDYESHGWGCIEIKRDGLNRIKRFGYVPAYTVRPLQGRGELVDVIESDAVTPLGQDREIIVKRRFAIYVQLSQGRTVYFKDVGDPRVVSRTTGRIYPTVKDLRRPTDVRERSGEGPEAVPANELLWFAQHDPTTPVPPPRWIGNLLSVLGGREADETNYHYLADSAIPAGLLFLHGGSISRGIRERVERRIQHAAKGAAGSGKIIIVEAKPSGTKEPDGRTIVPTMTFQSLRAAQTDDATFTKYDERNADRIGASFRLSPILRGYTPSDLNRATAIVALFLAEQQVFDPVRDPFDWAFNRWVLPELGIHLWQLKSNSPPTRSAEEVGKLVQQVAPHGGMVPEEIRDLVGDVLNKPFRHIDADWTRQPMVMTLQGISGDEVSASPRTESQAIDERLRRIEYQLGEQIREDLRAEGIDYDVQIRWDDPRDAMSEDEDKDEDE